MQRFAAVDRNPERIKAKRKIPVEHRFPVVPPHQAKSRRHAVVMIPDMLCARRRTDDASTLRMSHRFMIQRKICFVRKICRDRVKPFDTQDRVVAVHALQRSAVYVAVLAAGIASRDQQIKIDHDILLMRRSSRRRFPRMLSFALRFLL